MIRTMICFFLLLSVLPVQGQEGYHTKKKKAIQLYEEALQWSVRGDLNRTETLLKKSLAKDDSFDEAIVLMHQVLLRSNRPEQAGDWITANEMALDTSFRHQLKIDQSFYHFNQGDYQEARQWIVQVAVNDLKDDQAAGMQHLKANIDFSLEQIGQPRNIDFEALPKPLNEWTQQYFPAVFGNEHLVFTVRDMTGRGDEDLFVSMRTDRGWAEPKSISENINTQNNEGTASISADGKTLVFTSCNRPNNIGSCDLYISYQQNGQWKTPELLNENVNSQAWDSQPSLSSNGRVLYFVSRRPGGKGGQDIYRSELKEGEWQPAQNVGSPINTAFDDASPVILMEGSTLIFASKGNRGMGGFDLFQSEYKKGAWQEPAHLGYPINNAYDQVGYSISSSGWAYFSSEQPDGRIVMSRFRYPEELLPQVISPLEPMLRFINAETKQPIDAEIFLSWGEKNKKVKGADVNVQLVKSSEFMAYSEGYEKKKVSLTSAPQDTTFIPLSPVAQKKTLWEDPIYFGFDKTNLSASDLDKLDRLAAYIKAQNHLVFEIQGHTDASGPESYNLELSRLRAEEVRSYLLKKNVAKENLVIRSFGESRMLSKSYAKEGGLNNRRVEIIVLGLLNK